MRYLILSDIHANIFGLCAVVDHAANQFDQVLCLGDVVGYGAHPNECCELLQELGARCVVGNHDAASLGWVSLPIGMKSPNARFTGRATSFRHLTGRGWGEAARL